MSEFFIPNVNIEVLTNLIFKPFDRRPEIIKTSKLFVPRIYGFEIIFESWCNSFI